MKGYYWKVGTIHPAGALLLLVYLFASISLTPSEYFNCQSLFPDENLDFLGISKVAQKHFTSPDVTPLPAISSTLKHFWKFHHFLEAFSPQPTKAPAVLATLLRC